MQETPQQRGSLLGFQILMRTHRNHKSKQKQMKQLETYWIGYATYVQLLRMNAASNGATWAAMFELMSPARSTRTAYKQTKGSEAVT
jgi:hypothetical protein